MGWLIGALISGLAGIAFTAFGVSTVAIKSESYRQEYVPLAAICFIATYVCIQMYGG
jgi:hypothetical protein|tara:strand:+ start:293 stop:463 length:171 start_codon:yes stop_codon:yes gene_type:complete